MEEAVARGTREIVVDMMMGIDSNELVSGNRDDLSRLWRDEI